MGDRRFEREVLIKRVEGIRCLVQALSSLNDPHMEFTLLQSCFSLPEFSFSMRSLDFPVQQGTAMSFNEAGRGDLEEVLGSPCPMTSWNRSCCPWLLGALISGGLRDKGLLPTWPPSLPPRSWLGSCGAWNWPWRLLSFRS